MRGFPEIISAADSKEVNCYCCGHVSFCVGRGGAGIAGLRLQELKLMI